MAGSGVMLVFAHRPLLMCCRVVFDTLLRGFFVHFFPRFIAHVFTVVGIRATVNCAVEVVVLLSGLVRQGLWPSRTHEEEPSRIV